MAQLTGLRVADVSDKYIFSLKSFLVLELVHLFNLGPRSQDVGQSAGNKQDNKTAEHSFPFVGQTLDDFQLRF